MATQINGSPQTVDLGGGFGLRAPGLQGTAELLQPGVAATRAAAPRLDAGLVALEDALRASEVSEVKSIELSLRPPPSVPGAAASGTARAAGPSSSAGTIELDMPDLGVDAGQILVSIDDAGVVRWHLPLPQAPAARPSRSAHAVRRFRIPAPPPAPAPGASSGGSQTRSLFGLAGRLLLKALVYPITDPIFGAISDEFASRWEAVKRPYRVRRFTPDNYRDDNAAAIEADEIASLCSGGPVLLFVHGTFSTAHAAFGGLAPDAFAELTRRYSSRVIAFDHPTLSQSPLDNVHWLTAHLPDAPIQFDVVCHSRGGLVTRLLSERPASANLDAGRLEVRRVIFVGVPNNGTLLADPDHLVTMADRFTTALTFLPTGPVNETLEALVTLVKMLAHGALRGLDGLSSMHPRSAFLSMLNEAGSAHADYFAVTSNYEPTDHGLRRLASRFVDRAADEVFENVANDLVVPTEGVWQRNGNVAFPLRPERVFTLDHSQGVMHTGFFPHQAVANHLLSWLELAGH